MVEKTQVELQLDREAESPLYWQVYQHLRRLILEGTLPPGTRLPPTRELAARNDIGRVTAVQAYEQLQAEGLVESRTGAGTFVSTAIASTLPETGQFEPRLTPWAKRVLQVANNDARHHGRIDIDFGFGRSFPHIFPYDIWRRLLARYLSTDDIMLSRYGSPAGFWPLRRAIADHLARLRGVRCVPEQVVIVSGAQQALDILARLLLSPGDEVVVETPGYKDAFTLFQLHGARLQAVPVDDEGLPVEQIPIRSRARVVFVTPSHQFPKGGTLPLHRRLALLAWAREQGAMIVEDDYDGELRYESHPLAALQSLDTGGHVVYLGTFSKVLFPALRLGYVVLPPSLMRAFTRAKALVDRGAPTLTQAAIADFIGEGHFERHLRRLREAYAKRRETLVEALAEHVGDQVHYSNVPAGLHVMLYLPEGCVEEEVVARTAAAGVGVYPGKPYHLQQPVPPSVLLGFSGLNEEEIREGVRRLALVLCS